MAHYGNAKLAPKVVMSVHMPLELAEKLREAADGRGMSYSEAARTAIDDWAQRQPARSCHATSK